MLEMKFKNPMFLEFPMISFCEGDPPFVEDGAGTGLKDCVETSTGGELRADGETGGPGAGDKGRGGPGGEETGRVGPGIEPGETPGPGGGGIKLCKV